MAVVILTEAAQAEFDELPTVIQKRVFDIRQRLTRWPTVSGAKALRGNLHGSYRIRPAMTVLSLSFQPLEKPSRFGRSPIETLYTGEGDRYVACNDDYGR